jgi:hypothetical protein
MLIGNGPRSDRFPLKEPFREPAYGYHRPDRLGKGVVSARMERVALEDPNQSKETAPE